eukprot:COSAG04_NODE_1711_length_5840_cov_27.422923_2_plen_59_part_00
MSFLGLSVKNLGGEGLMGEGAVRLHIEDCNTENVNHGAQQPLGLGREFTVAWKRPKAK